jgi:ABC-type Zn uptake system ZnuABC Zn-binding protein ZnuA
MKHFIALVVLLLAPALARAELKIVTTTTDFADLARQIGGDKVSVHSVMKGPENVHNVMAKPTEMVFLNQADLFVHSGLDAEPWRDNLVKGARNPKVLPGKPGSVDMSQGIELKEVPVGKVDRSQGDVHAYGNPHYTASPAVAMRMTATLAKAIIDTDPANADLYRANARKVVTELADLHKQLRAELAPYRGLKIVTYHKAWEYFADAFGVEIVAVIEPKPAISPSAADLRRTIERAKASGAKVVVVETYNDPKAADFVAAQIGGKAVTLPDHVLGVPQVDTYQDLFRYDVHKLIETAKAAGVEPANAR